MTDAGRERDRALELRRVIRSTAVMLAATGTVVFGWIAASTLPGTAASSASSLQGPAQLPGTAAGGSGAVTGGSSVSGGSIGSSLSGGGLQGPAQAPTSGQGSSAQVITRAS